MANRITQEFIEVVMGPTSVEARSTQEFAEVVMSPTSLQALISQEYVEVIRPQATELDLTQEYIEVVSNYYEDPIARPRNQVVFIG